MTVDADRNENRITGMMCEDHRLYNQRSVMAQRYNLPGRRHGGGLDEDCTTDYGLAPSNLQRRAYVIKSRKEGMDSGVSASRNRKEIKPPGLERRKIRNTNQESSKYDQPTSKVVKIEHIASNTGKAEPIKFESRNGLSCRSDHSMSNEDKSRHHKEDSYEDEWDIEEIVPVAPQKAEGAILKLTHNYNGSKNNPRNSNQISIDDFSPSRPVRKSTVLLHKRKQPEAMELDDVDNLKAVTVLARGPLDQFSTRRHVGFNLGNPNVAAIAGYDNGQDVGERFVPRIGQRSKSLHDSGMDKLKPILKRNTDLPGHRVNQREYYDRFTRNSRCGDGAVKLPPISAPPCNTTSPRQRRKLKRETSMRINCSDEFASVVKDLRI